MKKIKSGIKLKKMNPNNPQQVFYHQQQPVPPVIQQQQQPLSQQQQPVMINNTIPPHIMQQQQQQPSTFSAPNPSSLHVRSVDINFSRAINEFNKTKNYLSNNKRFYSR